MHIHYGLRTNRTVVHLNFLTKGIHKDSHNWIPPGKLLQQFGAFFQAYIRVHISQ